MAARERVEFDVVGRDAGGSKAFRQVGDAAEKAADQVEGFGKESAKTGDEVGGLGDKVKGAGEKAADTAEQYRGLKHEIGEVEGNVRRLAAEIDRTGNKELFKDLRKQQSELRKLTRVRDLLPGDDETHEEAVRFGGRLASGVAAGVSRAGGAVSAALSNVFGTLPPQAQVAIGAGVLAAAVVAAAPIGAVISGAVVGAAGAGGIVGGVAIAAKHPQVQAAAKLTGDAFTAELQRAAVSFVPATVESLGIVRSDIGEIGEDLERAFSAGSGMLPGLTEKAMGGAKRAVEGFATAVERSGPVVDALGTIAERAGVVIGDTFESLSEHSAEGADALMTLWGVFEFGIRSVAGTIEMLTVAYGWLEKFGAVLTGDTAALGRMAAEQEVAKQSGNGLSQGLQDLINGFTQSGDKAATAAVEVESLNAAIKRLTGDNLSAEQANIRLEEAINRATEAGKANNAGITANTPKALANRSALVAIAEAANSSAEAIFKQTGSQELASAATTRGRQKFIESAMAMGASKKEAIALADKLFAIPNISRTVTVTANTQPAIDSAKGVVARINNMSARIDVYAEPHGSFGGSAHTGFGYSTGMSTGGMVTGDGPKGVDSQPRMLAVGEGVLTTREVDALGGPAGFERLRASIRSGQPGASMSMASNPSPGVGTADLLAELRALRQLVASTPLVRLDSGRQADMYARGG